MVLTKLEKDMINGMNPAAMETKLGDIIQSLQSGSGFNIRVVPVNVSAGNSNGASAADPELVGAVPFSIMPKGNQDQFVDNVDVEEDGKVRVTLAANATAQNQFVVGIILLSLPEP